MFNDEVLEFQVNFIWNFSNEKPEGNLGERITGESYVANNLSERVLIDDCLVLRFTRKVLNYHIGAFDRAHAKNCPEKSLQRGWKIDERVDLLGLDFRLVVNLNHVLVVLIQSTRA